MRRIRKLKRGTLTVIILSILMAVSIAFIRGNGPQGEKNNIRHEKTQEGKTH